MMVKHASCGFTSSSECKQLFRLPLLADFFPPLCSCHCQVHSVRLESSGRAFISISYSVKGNIRTWLPQSSGLLDTLSSFPAVAWSRFETDSSCVVWRLIKFS